MQAKKLGRGGWLGLVVVSLLGLGAVPACSAGDEPGSESELGSATEPLSGSCTINTFGLPCDPDGTGAAVECQGICWLDDNGSAACRPLADVGLKITDMNGRPCGDPSGSDCSSSCSAGQCVKVAAAAGAACVPAGSIGANTCSGKCTSLGPGVVCQPVPGCVSYGRADCTFNACNFLNNTSAGACRSYDLVSGTRCNDQNLCTAQDACDGAGVCKGTPRACGDGNACTTDVCDVTDGSCQHTNNTNTCNDGNKCTVQDQCSNGNCNPGTPRVCNDNNPCTVDSCDNNAASANGCVFTPKDCDDKDPCTADSCAAGNCINTPIPNCGTGGAGGMPGTGGAGGMATGGAGGMATGGTAGAGTGGSGGTAGAGTGGSGGTAGAGTGGTAGAGTGGSGGTSGSGGSGGTNGTGGSGGTSGTGGSGGSGGSGGTAGTGVDGGTDGGVIAGLDSSGDDSGCGCQIPGRSSGRSLAALALLGLAVGARRRRKR